MRSGVGLRALAGALCWSLAAFAQEATPATDTDAAEQHFTRGYALVEAHEYDAAALEFEQAYQKRPHHSVLYNLGQAYAMAGKHVQAVRALRAFLAQADKAEPALVERAKTALEKSERHVGRVRLAVTPNARVTLDGQALDEPIGELVVVAGAHGVWLQASGYRDSYQSFVVQAGQVSQLDIRLEPLPAPPAPVRSPEPKPLPAAPRHESPSRVWSYVLGGTGVALGAGALAIYAKNSASHREWQDRRDRFAEQTSYGMMTQTQREQLASLLGDATEQQRWDDVALGLGIGAGVSLGAAIVLFWRGAPSAEQPRQLSFDGRRMLWSTTW